MATNWDLLSTWQDHLNTLLDEKASIIGAPNFSMASMTVDQKSALDGLERGIAEARRLIIDLGGDSTAKTTRKAVSADTSLY